METTHNSVKVKLGIKVMKLVESLIGREVTVGQGISLTIWTICALVVQNPPQWFLAKQSSLKSWKEMSQKYQKEAEAKRDAM